MRKRVPGGEYKKARVGELVSRKDYITNNFPENGVYCLQCNKYIPNKYEAKYHMQYP